MVTLDVTVHEVSVLPVETEFWRGCGMLPVIAQLELVPFRIVDLRGVSVMHAQTAIGDDTTMLIACYSVSLVSLRFLSLFDGNDDPPTSQLAKI